MADLEPQQANHLPANPCSRPVLLQQNHVLRDAGIPSATHIDQLEGQWESVPPTANHGAVQDALQNMHHTNVVNYGTADYQELSGDLAGPYIYPNVGPIQVLEHVQADFPDQGCQCQSFGYVPQGIVSGSAQATFPGPSSDHRAPALGQPAAENLRRLASRYVNHPDSQVDMVRMEPGSTGRYRVVIVLDIADSL